MHFWSNLVLHGPVANSSRTSTGRSPVFANPWVKASVWTWMPKLTPPY